MGEYGFGGEVALNVGGKRSHGGVTAFGFLAQGLQKDRVEVAAQSRVGRLAFGAARWNGRYFADDAGRFEGADILNRVWQFAGQELIEQRGEREDIAGNAERRAFGLLRAGVTRRKQAKRRLGLGTAAHGLIKDARDTEVE